MRKFVPPKPTFDAVTYAKESDARAMRIVAQRMRRDDGKRKIVVERRPSGPRSAAPNPFDWLKHSPSPFDTLGIGGRGRRG